MATPIQPTTAPTSGPVPTPVPGDDAEIRALAAQLVSSATPSKPPLSLSQATIVDTDPNGTPPTASITIAGSSTQVDSVRYMSGYMPVAGDTVAVLIQNGSVLILGHTVDIGTPTATTGGWISAITFSSGFSNNGNGNGNLAYRLVVDNGVYKMQWKGSVQHTGTNTAIISGANVLVDPYVPASTRNLVTARDSGGGSDVVGLQFGSDGTVSLVGPAVGPSGTSGASSPGTTSVDTQSTVAHSHGGAVALSTITHDDGLHSHTVSSHTHSIGSGVSDPVWISFNGIEYFL